MNALPEDMNEDMNALHMNAVFQNVGLPNTRLPNTPAEYPAPVPCFTDGK